MVNITLTPRSRLVLECLQSAPVPWSDTIRRICSEGKTLSTPQMSDLIAQQEKLVVLKQVTNTFLYRDAYKVFFLNHRANACLFSCAFQCTRVVQGTTAIPRTTFPQNLPKCPFPEQLFPKRPFPERHFKAYPNLS
jgi:hypothetical protein